MADLYIMCGAPGSGKSTYLRNHLKSTTKVKIVSRDIVRFSLIKPGEPYFSKEKEVYKVFWNEISKGLSEGYDVFADQTSLTPKSRKYLIDNVTGYNHINALWINTPLSVCLERNENRTGREYVPPERIVDMYNSFSAPSFKEGFYRIYKVENDKIMYKEAPPV